MFHVTKEEIILLLITSNKTLFSAAGYVKILKYNIYLLIYSTVIVYSKDNHQIYIRNHVCRITCNNRDMKLVVCCVTFIHHNNACFMSFQGHTFV